MALEAVVFQQDLFSHKELYNLLGANWGGYDNLIQEDDNYKLVPSSFDHLLENPENFFDGENNWHSSSSPPTSMVPHFNELNLSHSSPDGSNNMNSGLTHSHDSQQQVDSSSHVVIPVDARAKRRRSRTKKNKEEIENQRITHIAVERNRRKQMNEYLAVLRSLMPESYAQRGDQASIIGGAINFVKELEQRLQLLTSHKQTQEGTEAEVSAKPFSEFFTFPQYTTGASSPGCDSSVAVNETMCSSSNTTQTQFALADIEVTMVESHASLKIRSKRRPKLLLKVVSGLQSMRLSILHLNVTTVDQTVLYSLSVKVEDDCKLTSVDEIARAVYQLLGRIQEEGL